MDTEEAIEVESLHLALGAFCHAGRAFFSLGYSNAPRKHFLHLDPEHIFKGLSLIWLHMKSDISSNLCIPFLTDIYNSTTLSNLAPARMRLTYSAHIFLACSSIYSLISWMWLLMAGTGDTGGQCWPLAVCAPLGITFTAILFHSELPAVPPLILDRKISQSKNSAALFQRLLVFIVSPYTSSSTLTSHPHPSCSIFPFSV